MLLQTRATRRARPLNLNAKHVAQGVANALCGVLGAMGGDAMIGQSTINVMNGARGRLSGAVAAVAMLCFILALSPVIELVPVGTLTGVLFVVVLNTFHWPSFRALRPAPRAGASPSPIADDDCPVSGPRYGRCGV